MDLGTLLASSSCGSEEADILHRARQQVLHLQVQQAGGRIDAIYHAPKLAQENSEMRKPNIGMALKAKKQFPEIEFQKSIMVGDSMSDIEFGKKAKMHTFLIGENQIYTSLFQLFQS